MRVWASLGLSVVILLLAPMSAAQAAFPGANGKIAFASGSQGLEGFYTVHTMNADGTGQSGLRFGIHPAWSPDGAKLAFSSDFIDNDHTDNFEIFTMNADGTGVTRLTTDAEIDQDPVWSPDGTKIAFERANSTTFVGDIYVMNADGSGQTNITNHPAIDLMPAWSPDGTMIAFSTNRDGNQEIYTMKPDGTELSRLTQSPADNESTPNWSPDGSEIAFRRNEVAAVPNPNWDIWKMNADGTEQTRLTTNEEDDAEPAWSPDGTKIAFASYRDNGVAAEIYTMNPDGSDQVLTAVIFGDNRFPDWQPLGAFDPYPRPGGATPLRVPLVPSFASCTTPTSQHAPPLDSPSCAPAALESSVLTTSTVGRGSASARLQVLPGDSGTTTDEADVMISASVSDVRCAQANAACPNGAGSDFEGNVLLRSSIRITDRASGYGGVAATVEDTFFQVPVSCTPTSDSGRGSDCAAETTADALIPNYVREGKRTVISAFSFELRDPGPNGSGYGPSCPPTCGDGDEATYLRQGIFAP